MGPCARSTGIDLLARILLGFPVFMFLLPGSKGIGTGCPLVGRRDIQHVIGARSARPWGPALARPVWADVERRPP